MLIYLSEARHAKRFRSRASGGVLMTSGGISRWSM